MRGENMNRYNYFNDNWLRNMKNDNFLNSKQQLFTPKEGFEKGNLFANIYSQYKDYRPTKLKADNEREKMLLELSEITFAAHELNLYLDVHTDDTSMITLYNDYRKKEMELTENYEQKYGPLTVNTENQNNNTFLWVKGTWPWERDINV